MPSPDLCLRCSLIARSHTNGTEFVLRYTFDVQRGKKVLMPYANSEGPDERVHLCSLVWTFSVRRHILEYPLILKVDNESPDQPARIRAG